MRRLGMIGGVTWHSTKTYYERLNQQVSSASEPYASADLVLRSLDYSVVKRCRETRGWKALGEVVVQAALDCQRAGAEGLLLGSNSLHALAPRVQDATGLPLLHIGDALGDEAVRRGLSCLALFGTGFTMRNRFLIERLEQRGIQVLLPADRDAVDRVIFEELALGTVSPASRKLYLDQLEPLVDQGAQAFVCGCTEIGMLIQPADIELVHLDTLELHAAAAAAWMLE